MILLSFDAEISFADLAHPAVRNMVKYDSFMLGFALLIPFVYV
ncbi:MAG: hypothetical protein K0S23_890 [Fluviicola sp.]|jgi:hypothetical protein|nr:hypothetical protein [Fluviicola sp.]MDF3026583.1 hypothetical protein [Fluviicola sp.]